MLRTTVFLSSLLGVLLFVVAVIIGGASIPGYSHAAHLISESYAMGTPRGPFLRFALYLPSGSLIALFSFAASSVLRMNGAGRLGFLGVGVFYGLGTVVTAFFPCDAGCGSEFVDPSVPQLIHSLTGFLTYLFTPVSLLMIGIALWREPHLMRLGTLALACGALALGAFILFMGASGSAYAGLIQRMIEGAVLVWITAAGPMVRCSLPSASRAGPPVTGSVNAS